MKFFFSKHPAEKEYVPEPNSKLDTKLSNYLVNIYLQKEHLGTVRKCFKTIIFFCIFYYIPHKKTYRVVVGHFTWTATKCTFQERHWSGAQNTETTDFWSRSREYGFGAHITIPLVERNHSKIGQSNLTVTNHHRSKLFSRHPTKNIFNLTTMNLNNWTSIVFDSQNCFWLSKIYPFENEFLKKWKS